MSEYKVTVNFSKLQHRLRLGFCLICILSVFFWPQIADWQWAIQLILVLGLGIYALRIQFTPGIEHELVLHESGDIHLYLNTGESLPFKLSPRSVTSDWFCYLVLLPDTLLPGSKGKKRIWLFRDGTDEQSYRRICRIIHRLRRG